MTHLRNILSSQAPTGSISRNLVLLGSAVSIYAAIFAGRFSVSRVLPAFSSDWAVLGEIRMWAVLAAAFLVGVGWTWRQTAESPTNMRQVWRCVALVAIAQLAVMAHTIFYLPNAHSAYFVWELTTIILAAGMLGLAYQVWGLRLVNALMWVALLFALVLALWMLAASLGPKPAGNVNPLATTFTFYRIQIFGGFAALLIMFLRNGMTRGVLVALCATLCFAAAYLSLSKAALLAGIGGTLFLAAVYVTWFEKLRAATVLAVSVAATVLFIVLSGGMFTARVAEGLLGVGYAMSTESVAPPTTEEGALGRPKGENGADTPTAVSQSRARTEYDAQRRLASLVACTAGNYPCQFEARRWERDIVDTMLRFRVYIPDFSFRIRLLMHGFSGISKAPWLGNGFGSFHAVAINLYTAQPESYSHPHNIVIELLYAVGILGALFVGGVLLILVWEVLRAKERIHTGLPLLAFVVSVCIGSVFGGDYMDFRLVWTGLLLSVMLCAVPALRARSLSGSPA